jgi:hypothetical protein
MENLRKKNQKARSRDYIKENLRKKNQKARSRD